MQIQPVGQIAAILGLEKLFEKSAVPLIFWGLSLAFWSLIYVKRLKIPQAISKVTRVSGKNCFCFLNACFWNCQPRIAEYFIRFSATLTFIDFTPIFHFHFSSTFQLGIWGRSKPTESLCFSSEKSYSPWKLMCCQVTIEPSLTAVSSSWLSCWLASFNFWVR